MIAEWKNRLHYGDNMEVGTAVVKDAFYRGAWETHSGEIGLWSEAVKATITG